MLKGGIAFMLIGRKTKKMMSRRENLEFNFKKIFQKISKINSKFFEYELMKRGLF